MMSSFFESNIAPPHLKDAATRVMLPIGEIGAVAAGPVLATVLGPVLNAGRSVFIAWGVKDQLDKLDEKDVLLTEQQPTLKNPTTDTVKQKAKLMSDDLYAASNELAVEATALPFLIGVTALGHNVWKDVFKALDHRTAVQKGTIKNMFIMMAMYLGIDLVIPSAANQVMMHYGEPIRNAIKDTLIVNDGNETKWNALERINQRDAKPSRLELEKQANQAEVDAKLDAKLDAKSDAKKATSLNVVSTASPLPLVPSLNVATEDTNKPPIASPSHGRVLTKPMVGFMPPLTPLGSH